MRRRALLVQERTTTHNAGRFLGVGGPHAKTLSEVVGAFCWAARPILGIGGGERGWESESERGVREEGREGGSEEQRSEVQARMSITYAVLCLKRRRERQREAERDATRRLVSDSGWTHGV
eukprot:COSAG03_NODE_7007_length_977_cov_0.583144_1_plen_121_part_10